MPFSRRQFLVTAAAVGMSSSLSGEAAWWTKAPDRKAANQAGTKVPIQPWKRPLVGSQIYGWGQYYQRNGKDLNFDEVFSALKTAGYDYAEGNLNQIDHAANARFSEQLRQHGLVPVSLYTGGAFHITGKATETAHRIAAAALAAQQHGFEIIVLNPDPIGRDKTDAELAIQASALAELGQELTRAGMKLGLHQHTPELRNGAHEFHANFQQTKSAEVGFCIDTHWLYRGGVAPLDALAQYGDRVCSWHLRQSRGGIWWEDLDAGDIDYTAIAARAKARKLPLRYTVELALEPGMVLTRDGVANHARSRQWVKRVFGV